MIDDLITQYLTLFLLGQADIVAEGFEVTVVGGEFPFGGRIGLAFAYRMREAAAVADSDTALAVGCFADRKRDEGDYEKGEKMFHFNYVGRLKNQCVPGPA